MGRVSLRLLDGHLAALAEAMDEAIATVPAGRLRVTLLRLRRRLNRGTCLVRLSRLRSLAVLAETQGWLEPRQVIVLCHLAYRVRFLALRLHPGEQAILRWTPAHSTVLGSLIESGGQPTHDPNHLA